MKEEVKPADQKCAHSASKDIAPRAQTTPDTPIEIDVGSKVCIGFFLLLIAIPAVGFVFESSQILTVYSKIGIGDKVSVHVCIILFHCYLLLYCLTATVNLIWPRRTLTHWVSSLGMKGATAPVALSL